LKSHKIGGHVWASRNLKRKENTAKGQDLAVDAGLMGQLFDVTIYICVGIVLGKWPKDLGSKNMSNEENLDGYFDKWFNNNHKQRNA